MYADLKANIKSLIVTSYSFVDQYPKSFSCTQNINSELQSFITLLMTLVIDKTINSTNQTVTNS